MNIFVLTFIYILEYYFNFCCNIIYFHDCCHKILILFKTDFVVLVADIHTEVFFILLSHVVLSRRSISKVTSCAEQTTLTKSTQIPLFISLSI